MTTKKETTYIRLDTTIETWDEFMRRQGIVNITLIDSKWIEIKCVINFKRKTITRRYWRKRNETMFMWKANVIAIPTRTFLSNVIDTNNKEEQLPPLPPTNKVPGQVVEVDLRSIREKIRDAKQEQERIETEAREAERRTREEQATGIKQDITTPDTTTQPDTPLPTIPPNHKNYSTIKTCVEQDIPVFLVGEAGTGKNHALQQIAEELELDFYFTNSVQQEYKLTGFIDAKGTYHTTEFYNAFAYGGLFFLDEMDASIPEVLVLINAAIANRYFEFPNGRINAHPDFRVVAAGNTVGHGASELYVGRLTLDMATLDRFVVIEFDYDPDIEYWLAEGNRALVSFVQSLRKFAKKNGLRMVFSYRCIMNIVKLEKTTMPLKQVLSIAVFKQVDKDTLKMLQVENAGKYYHAMRELQRVA